MANVPQLDIDRVARLARVALTAEERATFAAQLCSVLHHIEQLSKVNVDGVEPSAHAFAVDNVWREDVPSPALPVAEALRNAPSQRENMVVVPKVVE